MQDNYLSQPHPRHATGKHFPAKNIQTRIRATAPTRKIQAALAQDQYDYEATNLGSFRASQLATARPFVV